MAWTEVPLPRQRVARAGRIAVMSTLLPASFGPAQVPAIYSLNEGARLCNFGLAADQTWGIGKVVEDWLRQEHLHGIG
jgi:hypothetical protein